MTAWLPSWTEMFYAFCNRASFRWRRFNFLKRNSPILLSSASQPTPFLAVRKSIRLLAILLVSFACVFVFGSHSALASNVNVSAVSLVDNDPDLGTVKVQFTLTWAQAWRNNINRDAVWIFIKWSGDSGATWNHATMASDGTNSTGTSYTGITGYLSSLNVVIPTDRKGAFIELSATAQGNVGATVKLPWAFVSDAVPPTAPIRVMVGAIEMVYVPAASFYIGDGKNSASDPPGGFFNASSGSYATLQITAESALTLGGSTDGFVMSRNSMNLPDDFSSGTTKSLPADFPKGYNDFYVMKYELTQAQYKDFLNHITFKQQKNRVATNMSAGGFSAYVMSNTSTPSHRNIVRAEDTSGGNIASDTRVTMSTTYANPLVDEGDRAANFMRGQDALAYADWAALRPMTELEFEKAARGTLAAVASEYAWGSTVVTQVTTLSDASAPERDTTYATPGNAHYGAYTLSGGNSGTGPIRVGSVGIGFSYPTAATGVAVEEGKPRVITGASYYGVYNLSDNVQEMAVSVGNSTGRAFTGTHGDGVLTTTTSYEGNATNTDWPGIDSTTLRGCTSGTGLGIRGGGWSAGTSSARISDRANAARNAGDSTLSTRDYGFRAARTAP